MLSTVGMLNDRRVRPTPAGATAIMATETGMLHPLQMARARHRLRGRQRGAPAAAT